MAVARAGSSCLQVPEAEVSSECRVSRLPHPAIRPAWTAADMTSLRVDPRLFRRTRAQQYVEVIDRHLRVALAVDQQHPSGRLPEEAVRLQRHARAIGEKFVDLLHAIDEAR